MVTTWIELVDEDYSRKIRNIQIMLVAILLVTLPTLAFAATDSGGLLDVFSGAGVQGNWVDASKFNWVGAISTYLISALCIMGAFAPIVQKLITVFYLTTPGFWDQVYEYQEEDSGGRFLGVENVWNNVFKSAKRGTGLNAFVGFAMSMLVNVKELSDYNPKRMPANLSETDTLLQYILKSFFPTVAILTVLSMGWNGSLWRGYANVADGLGAIGERMVNTSLRTYIEKIQNRGEAYKFTLKSPTSKSSAIAEDIAKSLYSKVVGRTGMQDTPLLMSTGLKIEQTVYKDLLGSQASAAQQRTELKKHVLKPASGEITLGSEEDVSSLKWSITDSTNPKAQVGELVFKMSDLVGSGTVSADGDRYYHVVLSQKGGASINYFKAEDDAPSKTPTTVIKP